MTSPRKLREKLEEGIMKDMRENIMHKHNPVASCYPSGNEPKLTNAELRAVRKLIQVPPDEYWDELITPEMNILLHMIVAGIPRSRYGYRNAIQFDKEGAKDFVARLADNGWKLTKI